MENATHTVGRNVTWCSHHGEIGLSFCTLNIELPYDPAVLLLGIDAENTNILPKIHAPQCPLPEALFTRARPRKQPNCPSTRDEEDAEYLCNYSAIKE